MPYVKSPFLCCFSGSFIRRDSSSVLLTEWHFDTAKRTTLGAQKCPCSIPLFIKQQPLFVLALNLKGNCPTAEIGLFFQVPFGEREVGDVRLWGGGVWGLGLNSLLIKSREEEEEV